MDRKKNPCWRRIDFPQDIKRNISEEKKQLIRLVVSIITYTRFLNIADFGFCFYV